MSGTYELIPESPRLLTVRIVGALSIPDTRALVDHIFRYTEEAGGPIYMLAYVHEIQVMNPGARVHFIEMMRNPRLAGGAFIGAPLFAQLGIKVVATAAGALNRIRFYPDEAAARAWIDSLMK